MDLLIGNDICQDIAAADVGVVTRSQTAALRRQTKQDLAQAQQSVPDNLAQADEFSDMGLASLFEESESSVSIPFELVNRAEVIRLQQNDSDLLPLFELVGKSDDRYTMLSGVLVRNWCDNLAPSESSIHQIVVPTSLHAKLLHIAHDIPAAGHLGVAKTFTSPLLLAQSVSRH